MARRTSFLFPIGIALVGCGPVSVEPIKSSSALQVGAPCATTCMGEAPTGVKTCANGTSLAQACLVRGDGTCGWDFPACPASEPDSGAPGGGGSGGTGATGGAGGTLTGGAGGTGGTLAGGAGGTAVGGASGAGGTLAGGAGGAGGTGGAFDSGLDARVDADSGPCVGASRDGAANTIDLLVLFDSSASMSCDVVDPTCTIGTGNGGATTRLAAVSTAINNFVGAPANANVRVGLAVFPNENPAGVDGGVTTQCTFDYSQLSVPIAPASANAAAIGAATSLMVPHLGTPTEQALTGAYSAARAYMAANRGRNVAVVLVTDGMPLACNDDPSGTVSAGLAKAAFDGTPSIKTYVLGIGATTTLDPIALAGTGGATHYTAGDANVTQRLQTLLTQVSTASNCD
jgi:hypothetical protein